MKIIHVKYKTIGQFLKFARVKSGLSQGDVMRILKYKTPQLISDWERGICGPPKKSLSKLRKAYGIKSNVLIDLFVKAERKELESLV